MTAASAIFAVLSLVAGAAPRAQVSTAPPPVLLMVRAASTGDNEKREVKLYEELSLVLDSFLVMSVPAADVKFASLPLPEQIEAVLPEARDNQAVAVVWMSFPLPKQVMVHLVVLGSGRALVRTIETDRTSASSIALIARELLGTAYLFEPAANLPAEVKQVVTTVKEEIAAAETATSATVPELPEARPWELWGSAAFRHAVWGGVDAVPFAQLAFGFARALGGFRLGLSVDAGYSSISRPAASGAQYLALGGLLSLSYGFGLGTSQFTLGPKVAAGADVGVFFAGAQTLANPLPRLAAGLEARTRRPGPAFAVSLLGVYSPLGAELVGSDGGVVFRTPNLEVELAVAFGWEGL